MLPIPKLVPPDQDIPEGYTVINTKDDGTRVCILTALAGDLGK